MNRITHMMRGLYKRGKIYWIAYKAAGRIIRESTGTPDPKLAEHALIKRRAEVFEGRWLGRVRDTRTPLQDAIREFLALYSRARKVSWKDDELILKRFAAFLGGSGYIQDIDRRTIERFQLHLLSRPLSKPRVNRYIAAIKCFFNRCVDWQKIEKNPCRGIKLYAEAPRTSWLEAGQIARLLENCSPRLKPVVEVALLTGLRRGDILRLTWDGINLEQRIIRVVQGKTQTSLVVPISNALAKVLQAVRRDPDCPYVFHEKRKPLRRYGWVRTDFVKARKAAGLPATRFHDLRHTAATQLRRLGRDLQVVQQLLGHKTIRTTLRYSHVHPTELRDAVNKLGEKILPDGPRHFTITSQSGDSSEGAKSAPGENNAKIRAGPDSAIPKDSPMPQTVNLEQSSSEEW